MAEEQLKEVQDLLDQYHLSASPLLQVLRSFVADDSDNESVNSDHSQISNTGEGGQKKRFHLDYLVFGYHVNQGQNYQNKLRDNHLDIELREIVFGSSSTSEYAPPWSREEPLLVHVQEKVVNIVMSPFTTVLGTASGFNCFCKDTFHKLDFKESRLVRVRCPLNPSRIEPYWVKGIVIPKEYPDGNCIKICRKIKSNRLQQDPSHFVTSGIGA